MSETELGKTGGVVRTIVATVSDEITRINQEIDRLDKVVRVVDRAARDAIPAADRYEGLWVEVLGEAKVYRLTDGLTNAHWQERVGVSAVGVPVADADQYGVVKIGSGIVLSDGTISVPEVKIATTKAVGLVKGGGNVTIAADGMLSVPDVIDMIARGFGRKQLAPLSATTTPPSDFDQLWDTDRIAALSGTGQLNGPGLGPCVMLSFGISNVYRAQLAISYDGRMSIRAKANGTLRDWVEVATGNTNYAPAKIEVITASKTWTAPKTGIVHVTCVGGGGGGGGSGVGGASFFGYSAGGGGGGCGKIVEGFLKVTKGQTIAAVIGAGGAGGAGGNPSANGSAGGTTSFGSIAAGGGNGGGRSTAQDSPGNGGIGGDRGTYTVQNGTDVYGNPLRFSGLGGNGGLNYKIRNGSTWFGGGGNGGSANSAGTAGTAGAIELRY